MLQNLTQIRSHLDTKQEDSHRQVSRKPSLVWRWGIKIHSICEVV